MASRYLKVDAGLYIHVPPPATAQSESDQSSREASDLIGKRRIARVLATHTQRDAVGRAHGRKMDELVEVAGFRKIDQRIDEWGIFSVSLAVRRPS